MNPGWPRVLGADGNAAAVVGRRAVRVAEQPERGLVADSGAHRQPRRVAAERKMHTEILKAVHGGGVRMS